jgi:hypothetical protein
VSAVARLDAGASESAAEHLRRLFVEPRVLRRDRRHQPARPRQRLEDAQRRDREQRARRGRDAAQAVEPGHGRGGERAGEEGGGAEPGERSRGHAAEGQRRPEQEQRQEDRRQDRRLAYHARA